MSAEPWTEGDSSPDGRWAIQTEHVRHDGTWSWLMVPGGSPTRDADRRLLSGAEVETTFRGGGERAKARVRRAAARLSGGADHDRR